MSTTTIPLTSKEKQRRSDLLQRFKSFLAVTSLMDCVDEYLEGNNNSKLLQNTK